MPLTVAKRFLRRLRMKQLGIYEQVSVPRLPLAYNHGAWMVCPDSITSESVVYSFGVGSNIAWDLAMIERFAVTIHAFDPTPRCVEWIRSQDLPPEFVFHEYGVAGKDGRMTFYPPLRNSSFNYSSIDRGRRFDSADLIRVPVRRLATIMRELGHDRIDVLKMDIEGGEYDVIEDLVESRVKVGQILVEFHHNFRSVSISRTVNAIEELVRRGFRIFHISDRGYEMSLINGRVGVGRRSEPAPRAELQLQHAEV